MKRGLVLLAFAGIILIAGMFFASAGYHDVCNTEDNPDKHGVYINGVCFDCGEDDGICPDDYGASCKISGIIDPDCEYVEDAFWSEDGANPASVNPDDSDKCIMNFLPDEKTIYLVISSIGIDDGNRVNFTVRQYGSGDDIINENIHSDVSGGNVVASWDITSDEWDIAEVDDFFFEAVAEEYELDSKDPDYDPHGILTLNFSAEDEEVINVCSDYTDETNCSSDPETVGNNGVVSPYIPDDNPECEYPQEGFCAWSSSTEVCVQYVNRSDDPDNPECEPAPEQPCDYPTEEKIGDCDAGDQFFKVRYSSTTDGCDSWETQPIPCPAKLRVPFFGVYSIIASISIIALIYCFYFFASKKENL